MKSRLALLILFAVMLSACNFPTTERPQSEIVAPATNTARAETQEAEETEMIATQVVQSTDAPTQTPEPSPTATPTAIPTPITLPPRSCGEPSGMIIYQAIEGLDGGKDVITIKPDGSEYNNIPDGGYVGQFLVPHPNGSHFLYQDGLTYFHTRDIEGYNKIKLTNRIIFADDIQYASDGSKISYLAFFGEQRHIYIMDADGTSQFALTEFGDEYDEDEIELPTNVWSFDWSPNLVHIAFEGELNGQRDIFLIEADGGQLRNLTNTPDVNEYAPVYSPGGTLIAYNAGPSPNDTDLHLMNASGTNQYKVIDLNGRSSLPTWSHDGYQIAFISDHDGDEEVYIVDPDGEDFAQLTHNETREHGLSWSPDNCWLGYRSVVGENSQSELFRITPDGSEVFQITDNNSWILKFFWLDTP